MTVTRRALISRGLIGGALLAVGGGTFLALRPTRMVELPSTPLQVLNDREYSILAAVTGRILVGPRIVSEAASRTPAALDALLATTPPRVQKDVRNLLMLLENALAGFLLDQETTPFTQRTPEAQDATLARWATSRITLRRSGYQALTQLTLATYYGDPLAHAATGYPGPPDLHVPPLEASALEAPQ